MNPLTPKQKQVFDFIARHIEGQGFAPSQQEIAKAFGFRSLGTVQNYLVRLERAGLLNRDWNGRRSLRLAVVAEQGMQLPLAGTVAAGKPIEAIEMPDTIHVPPEMVGAGEHFVLHVEGNSMIDDGILDGDYLVVRKQRTAENGQTVIALLDNEATVKRLQRHDQAIELHPANASMQPIIVDPEVPFDIAGVVVGVIRHYR